MKQREVKLLIKPKIFYSKQRKWDVKELTFLICKRIYSEVLNIGQI